MAQRDASHGRQPPPRRRGRWLVVVLVLLLAAGGAATWRFDLYDEYAAPLVEDWFGEQPPAAPPEPAVVAPPPGLDLPPVVAPAAVAGVTRSRGLSQNQVSAALTPYLGDRDLGRHVVAAVAPLARGGPTYTSGQGTATPASTTKVVTTAAALLALGPDHVFTTSVVAGGPRRIVLVGGGDPFLGREKPDADTPYPARADVVTLAQRTATRLRKLGRTRVSIGYDDSLFTGPAANPTWEPDYVPDGVVSPITSLWVEQGRSATGYGRVGDPALTAAATFAGALSDAGIEVVGVPERGVAGAGGTRLAQVRSAPLSAVVERILDVSDNEASEVLLRHVGLADSGEGSSAAGQQGVERLLDRAGVDLGAGVLHDGSGLSRANRLAPETLVDVLRLAASPGHPELRPVITGLPVAGFTGSLTDRFDGPIPEARGRVRAKTGTLTGVFSLAGVAVGPDGVPMVFALMSDRIRKPDTLDALETLDNAAAALGACRCGR